MTNNLKEKISNLEKKKNKTFSEMYHIREEHKDKILLFHGIRFHKLERLECIFKEHKVLSGNKVPYKFKSYTNEEKYTYVYNYGTENVNNGEYVSVMPEIDSLEYKTFVEENIHLAFNGLIPAVKTEYLSYDEYEEARKLKNTKRLYSYARDEYLVKDEIDLSNLVYIGVNKHFQTPEEMEKIIRLMKHYNIEVPLIECNTFETLYEKDSDKVYAKR